MPRIICAIILLLAVIAPASAGPVDLLDRRIASGDVEGARVLAAGFSQLSPSLAWLPSYVDGYRCLTLGDAACAESRARGLLAQDRRNMRARHLLINALAAQGRHRAAVYHIRRNLALASDPQVVKEYEGALAAYDKRNPSLGLSLSMSATPSTNATRGTEQEIVYLNDLPFRVAESSRAKSGSTVTGGLTLYRRFALGERSDLLASVTTTLERGVEDPSGSVVTVAPALSLQHDFGATKLSAGPVAEIQWQDGDLLAYRMGGAVNVSRAVLDNTEISLALRMMSQTYPDMDYLDGYKASAEIGLRRRFTPDLAGTVSLELERQHTQARHMAHNLAKVSAGLEKYWPNGLYTDVTLSYQAKTYDEAGALSSAPRRDDQFQFQVGVAHERLKVLGVMPYVGYRYTQNRSNVGFYAYESNDLVISGRVRF